MRSTYKITDDHYPYFLTATIVEWIPVFTSKTYMDIIIDSIKFCQKEKELSVYALVIMDNHFHLIAQAPQLSRTIQALKRHTSSRIIKQLQIDKKEWLLYLLGYFKKKYKSNSDYQVWQEGSHPHKMFNHKILIQKMSYLHFNPVKRGWVAKPENWLYSSARNYYLNDHSLLKLEEMMPF